MSYDERAKAVDDFNNHPGQFVFLISTRAGGVGLDITSADKLVLVRDVEVSRLISSGTIE
ncbi:hypothetical protein KEM54_000186 [Ascosphaera aggregata]|nr:hypothetical protein KEM54_000186 [Ascosphaera aggregata]